MRDKSHTRLAANPPTKRHQPAPRPNRRRILWVVAAILAAVLAGAVAMSPGDRATQIEHVTPLAP